MTCERCGTVFCWDEADEYAIHGRKLYCSNTCKTKASSDRVRLRRQGQRRLAELAASLKACNEQGKRRFPSKEKAEAAAAAAAAVRATKPLYVYRCPGTDHWHVTSKKAYGRRRAEPVAPAVVGGGRSPDSPAGISGFPDGSLRRDLALPGALIC